MMWRTERGLGEPTPVAIMWLWAERAGTTRHGGSCAGRGIAGSPESPEFEPQPIARRLAARGGGALFDPVEFARMGGWALLSGALPQSVH
jgi:hypothetical protein